MARNLFRFELVSLNAVWHDAAADFAGSRCINPDVHLIHILRGRGMMHVGSRRLTLAPGRAFWIPTMTPYICGKEGGEPLEMVNVHFHLDLAGTSVNAALEMPPCLTMPHSLIGRLRRWARMWRSGGVVARGQVAAAVHGLILTNVERWAKPQPASGHQDSQMDALRRALEAAVDRPYDAEHFAEQVHLSVSQMNRRFRAAFGISPRVCHEQRRLAHVQTMLRQSQAPINQLAEELGFRDPFYFCRWFARHCGMPPSVFRRESHTL